MKECRRTACSNGCKLAEEKELDTLPTAVECHLSGGQEDACKFGYILNIHVLLRLPIEFEVFLFRDQGDDLFLISICALFNTDRN